MDPLERHLADAVNVEPSPEFVARVRARVATEPSPARAQLWPLMIAAGLVAALAAAVNVGRFERQRGATAIALLSAPPAASVPEPTRVRAAETAHAPVARRHPTATSDTPSIEVIVAAEDVRGLQALANFVRDGRVAVIFPEETPEVEPLDVKEIVVVPVDIAPLAIASNAEQGDEQ